jgi:hypothetical protein
MYDFLYDQQDVYDFYYGVFEERQNNYMMVSTSLTIRRPELPFSYLLESFDDILIQFNNDEEMNELLNLRWYIFNFETPNKTEKTVFK